MASQSCQSLQHGQPNMFTLMVLLNYKAKVEGCKNSRKNHLPYKKLKYHMEETTKPGKAKDYAYHSDAYETSLSL